MSKKVELKAADVRELVEFLKREAITIVDSGTIGGNEDTLEHCEYKRLKWIRKMIRKLSDD